MHRRTVTGALVVAVAASLALTGCSSKSTNSGGPNSGSGSDSNLSIQVLAQYDKDGNELKAASDNVPADPAGDGKAKCSNVSIAMAGALTGGDAALGINIVDGVKLALDQHNKANADCQVGMEKFDTEGSPDKAGQVIPTIINNAKVVGLVGPAFSGESKAVDGTLSDAGLASLTASATNPTLSSHGWKTFFRGLASDALQGPAIANYVVKVKGAKKVCVIDDSEDYGTGIAKTFAEAAGPAADPTCAVSTKKGDKDYSAVVTKMKAANPDAIFFGGYFQDAAPLVTQLRDGGVKAIFSAGDGVNDSEFVKQAGAASKGAILGCPCGVGPQKFRDEYKASAGQEAGIYSAEAYDLTTILLKGIDAGKTSRADLLDFVKNYDGQGLQGAYKWDSTGELTKTGVWMYEVK